MKSTAKDFTKDKMLAYFQRLLPDVDLIDVTELGGGFSSSQTFRLKSPQKNFFARKSGAHYGKEGFLHEIHAQQHAANFGIAPPILAYDDIHLVTICTFIDDHGVQILFDHDPSTTLKKLIDRAHAIHALPLDPVFQPRNLIHETCAMISKLVCSSLSDNSRRVFDKVARFSWPQDHFHLVHFDFRQDNVLLDGDHLWVIDWETAGLGHPFFDLATLSNFLQLNQHRGHAVLDLYLKTISTPKERTIFDAFRAISFAFLAAVNFLDAAERECGQAHPVTHHMICAHNALSAWARAAKTKDSSLHYCLGTFFCQEATTYAYAL